MPSPYHSEDEYFSFMRRAVRDLGFKALKLQTFAFCASPTLSQARKVFETAAALEVQAIIHTGNGVPVELPPLAIPIAKAYPKLKIALAHSGSMYGTEALIAAQTCENIYLETSWCTVMDINAFADEQLCLLAGALERVANASSDINRYVDADFDFHFIIMIATDNPILAQTQNIMREVLIDNITMVTEDVGEDGGSAVGRPRNIPSPLRAPNRAEFAGSGHFPCGGKYRGVPVWI